MKLVSILFSTLAITSSTMAALGDWEWCAKVFTCDKYMDKGDCAKQAGCRDKMSPAGVTVKDIGCGSGFYPRSCWVANHGLKRRSMFNWLSGIHA